MNICKLTVFILVFFYLNSLSQNTHFHKLPSNINDAFIDSLLTKLPFQDKRIIVLGEEGHGSELTNVINAKFIKKLCEAHGYKTLIIESDCFALSESGEYRDINFFRENLYSAWSASIA